MDMKKQTADPSEKPGTLTKSPSAKTANRKAMLLIVEDEDDIRELTRFQLEDAGYSVIESVDGEEAVKMAKMHLPDMILMDINVPFIDGINACRVIKNRLAPIYNKDIPVVMVTAKSSDEAMKAAARAGADGYVVKPFTIEHLLGTIKEVLKRH
jgi:CheY-like chemotaxis protein